MEMIIETTHLRKNYKDFQCLKDINLKVPKGSIYGFMGSNGAGKTTTIKILLGLVKQSGGSVHLFGEETTPHHRMNQLKKIGSLIECPSYYGHLSGEENMSLIASLRDTSPKKIGEVLELVGLLQAKNQKVSQYSLGMKQRLGIGMALLGSPELLLLDEPTNGLDPQGIQSMRHLFKRLRDEYNTTVFISSHLLGELDQLITHGAIIHNGHLCFQGTIDALRKLQEPTITFTVGQIEKLQAYFIKKGYQPYMDIEHHTITLHELKHKEVPFHVHQLSMMNLDIYGIQEYRKTLEDLYLDLTGTDGR